MQNALGIETFRGEELPRHWIIQVSEEGYIEPWTIIGTVLPVNDKDRGQVIVWDGEGLLGMSESKYLEKTIR